MEMNDLSVESLGKLRITDSSDVPDMETVISISGMTYAIKGDVSVIGGKEKAGKTSIAIFIILTALMKKPNEYMDTLGIKSSFAEGKPIVFVDTEQSKSSTKKFVQTVIKIGGFDRMPENLYAYNLRSLYKAEAKKRALDLLLEEHSNAHLFVIDGIADLITDPNLSDPSNALIAELMAKAEEYYTCIIVFIHENPGQSTKFRGNLGSELQRKCYGAVGIKKDKQKGVHCIESRLLRHSGDFEDIFFRYDKEQARMVSLNNVESEDYKLDCSGEREKQELRYKLAYQCLVGGSEQIRHNEFIRRMLNHAPLIEGKTFSAGTAKSRLQDMIKYGIVEKAQGDRYHLIQQGDSQNQKEGDSKEIHTTHTPQNRGDR